MGRTTRKYVFEHAENAWDSDSSNACAKSPPSICSALIHSIMSDDSVRGQRSLVSDCSDAQTDLGLCCPHMSEDTF